MPATSLQRSDWQSCWLECNLLEKQAARNSSSHSLLSCEDLHHLSGRGKRAASAPCSGWRMSWKQVWVCQTRARTHARGVGVRRSLIGFPKFCSSPCLALLCTSHSTAAHNFSHFRHCFLTLCNRWCVPLPCSSKLLEVGATGQLSVGGERESDKTSGRTIMLSI